MHPIITQINSTLSPLVSLIQKNRPLIARALLALSVMVIGFLWFPQFQKDLGEVAYTLLLVILIAAPLSRVSGIKIFGTPLLFRRELGILMGMIALMHYFSFLIANWEFLQANPPEPTLWMASGFLGIILTVLLLLTSNDWAVKKMGKWWKRVHRLVYVILVLVIVHVVALRLLGRPLDYAKLFDVLLMPVLFILIK
jgi:DMSO/TMAO reductase YedYZ heme-binding membrane subunit